MDYLKEALDVSTKISNLEEEKGKLMAELQQALENKLQIY